MIAALCPHCKRPVERARPVRVPTDPDDKRWQGRTPDALGFACPSCGVLLPLSSPSPRDDASS